MNKSVKVGRYIQLTRLLAVAIALAMELFGKYVRLKFATSPSEYVYNQTNYISTVSFGNGNVFPMMVFASTVLLLAFIIWELISCSPLGKKDSIVGVCAVVCNVLPVVIGMQVANIGVAIVELLLFIAMLLPLTFQRHFKLDGRKRQQSFLKGDSQ